MVKRRMSLVAAGAAALGLVLGSPTAFLPSSDFGALIVKDDQVISKLMDDLDLKKK